MHTTNYVGLFFNENIFVYMFCRASTISLLNKRHNCTEAHYQVREYYLVDQQAVLYHIHFLPFYKLCVHITLYIKSF